MISQNYSGLAKGRILIMHEKRLKSFWSKRDLRGLFRGEMHKK